MLSRICVFCGSRLGADRRIAAAARALGLAIAARGCTLVYGGGRAGLMGVLADAVLAAGGRVEGVIPRAVFATDVVHDGLSALHVVDSMLSRKALMIDLAQACITLPGGFGTLDEFFEVLTWSQLRIRVLPCGVLNVAGYYDGLIAFMHSQVAAGFVRSEHLRLLQVHDESEVLLERLARRVPGRGPSA